AELEHLARPQAAPTVQPCKRRHDPALACNRCAEAREPVTTGCEGPLCRQTADDLVVYWPERGVAQVRALCPTHRDAFTARNQGAHMQVSPLADGPHSYFAHGDGTQIATCRHCGHAIYLYPALRGRREPWRDGEYDETGRCTVGEQRHGIRVVHEPAVTLTERDWARTASTCSTTRGLPPPPVLTALGAGAVPRAGPPNRQGVPGDDPHPARRPPRRPRSEARDPPDHPGARRHHARVGAPRRARADRPGPAGHLPTRI